MSEGQAPWKPLLLSARERAVCKSQGGRREKRGAAYRRKVGLRKRRGEGE